MYHLRQLYSKHLHGGRNVLTAKESGFSLDSRALIGILSKVNIYIHLISVKVDYGIPSFLAKCCRRLVL